MLAKSKIISIILAIIFGVSAVTCGIVFGVSKSQPQSGAITGTETSLTGYIGNLLTSDGYINDTTYNSLISKVGAIGSVSSTQSSANINSGTPVVFQMGTAGGNPVYWQITYRTKDYITVMMTRPYTVEYFNYDGKTYASGIFAGATKTDYDQDGNYSRSTLRQATQQIYTDMNSTNSVLSQIVVSPSAMASATSTNWQYSSTEQPDAQYISNSHYSHHNALYSYSGSYYNTWTWDNTVYSDMFWIPSFYELYNTSTSSDSFNGGLWGLSSQSYAGFEKASFLNSGVTTSYCWLRSGESFYSGSALRVKPSGVSGDYHVNYAYGVRPAAHLSLSSMYDNIEWVVSFNSNGGSACASINVLNNTSYGTLPTPTKTGYSFAGWYKNSDLSGSPVTSSDIVTADHTLYAKWMLAEVSGSSTILSNYEMVSETGTKIYYLIPQTGHYVSEFSFDNINFYAVECYSGQVVDFDFAPVVTYMAGTKSNQFTLKIEGMYLNYTGAINIYLKTTNTPYTNLKEGGSSVSGIAVTSTKGGTAYIVGDDFESLADTDTVTIATKANLSGYVFSHWEDMNGNNLGAEMSIRLQKAVIMDNVITAVYVENANSSTNDDLNNV